MDQTGTDVGHALGDRFLIDIDSIAVPGRELACVACALRKTDQQQPNRCCTDDLQVVEDELKVRDGQPRPATGHIAHKGHPHIAETEDSGGNDADSDQDQCPGHTGRLEAQYEDQDQR